MEVSNITISDLEITDLRPRVKDKKYEQYLPTVLFHEEISFVIHGVSNAVSCGLRRAMSCEIPVLAMYAEYHTFKSNDEYHIPEMILKRLRMIPVHQSTPPDTQFHLEVVNNTTRTRDVMSSEITMVPGGHKKRTATPFNETWILCTLKPGGSLEISPIGLQYAIAYNPGDGMHAVAVNAVSIPTDQKPINLYKLDDGGIPSRISNPRVYKIKFTTNGSMAVKDIVIAGCDNIIGRINLLIDLLPDISQDGNLYILNVEGESDTVGNLMMRTTLDLYPDIDAVNYKVYEGRLIIRVRCDEDIKLIFVSVIKHIVEIYTTIKYLISELITQ